MLRFVFALFTASLLAACATVPSRPSELNSPLPAGARVGVLVASLDGTGVHEHIGFTVFNNFSSPKQFPWDLGARTRDAFQKALTSSGLLMVPLSASDIPPSVASTLIVASGDKWQINSSAQATLDRLRREKGLSALVAISGTPTLARMECFGGPCVNRMLSKSGLFSRGTLNLISYNAVAAMDIKVFRLDVPANLSAYEPLSAVVGFRSKFLSADESPKNVHSVTDEEFGVVTRWIDVYIDEAAAASAQALAGLRAGGS